MEEAKSVRRAIDLMESVERAAQAQAKASLLEAAESLLSPEEHELLRRFRAFRQTAKAGAVFKFQVAARTVLGMPVVIVDGDGEEPTIEVGTLQEYVQVAARCSKCGVCFAGTLGELRKWFHECAA